LMEIRKIEFFKTCLIAARSQARPETFARDE
jgi:hypothetical protein